MKIYSYHVTQKVKTLCDKLNIIVIFIPASLTGKYHHVDVCYAGPFEQTYTQYRTAWFVKQLQKAYKGEEGAYRHKSKNFIRPSMVRCVLWANMAHEKMKLQKETFKRKAKELYMASEDEEMTVLMQDHYAGKFKCSYNPAPWAKK